ncbi:MAG: 5'-nucleotidase C-terminal domain-containing protein [Lachnospiraceae bacterium]|nr:5'-nucleotidase C-terminal domain-containing protein [Lachnospiraceae bacterium]
MKKFLKVILSITLVMALFISNYTYLSASNEKSFSKLISKIDSSDCMNNYFGFIDDNEVIQLANDIKTVYCIDKFQDDLSYDIIAASSYLKHGDVSANDYVDIREEFYEYNLDEIIDINNGLYCFKVKGNELKEMLEYSASCYNYVDEAEVVSEASVEPVESEVVTDEAAEPVESEATTDEAISPEATDSEPVEGEAATDAVVNAKPLIDESWEGKLDNVSIFDGIEYTIDTTKPARYTVDGELNSDSERITEYTINGEKPDSDKTYLLVTDSYPDIPLFEKFTQDRVWHDDASSYRKYAISYLEGIAEIDNVFAVPDFNFYVKFNDNVKYEFTTGAQSYDFTQDKDWIMGAETSDKGYIKYQLSFGDSFYSAVHEVDTVGPSLVVSQKQVEGKANQTEIYLRASDRAGISSVKYVVGKYSINSSIWNTANKIKGNFTVSENAIYSILATDENYNRTIKYIKINCIDSNFIEKPVVNEFTNTSNVISGTAIAEGVIGIETENYIYRTTSDASGNFSYKIPYQDAGKVLYVFAEDNKGNISERTAVDVVRNGPNKPTVNAISSNSKNVTGKINDEYAYPMLLVNNKELFIMSGNTTDFYKKSKLYNSSYTVKPVNVTFEDDGSFTFKTSHTLLSTDTAVLYTIDIKGRVSAGTTATITAKKPVKPTVDASTVTNKSKKITVYENEPCTVYAKVNKKTYTQTQSTYDSKLELYAFKINIPRTDSGVKIKIYGKNSIGKSTVLTVKKTEAVPDTPVITSVSAGKKYVKGKVHIVGKDKKSTVKNTKTKVFVWFAGKKYTAKVYKSGKFTAKTKKALKSRKKVTVQAQNLNGKSLKTKVKVS